jgi:hypothetical protein
MIHETLNWKPIDTSEPVSLDLMFQAASLYQQLGVECFGRPPADATGAYTTEFGPNLSMLPAGAEYPWTIWVLRTGDDRFFFDCTCDAPALCPHALTVLFERWLEVSGDRVT